MNKKFLFIFGIFMIFIWGICVWHTNNQYPVIPEENYQIGEWVDLSENKMEEMDDRSGYSLRVDNWKIIALNDYLNLYAKEAEKVEYEQMVINQYIWKPEKVYLITVTLKNNSDYESSDKGINWTFFYLYEKNRVLDFDTILYKFANRSADGSPSLSLKPGTEKEFYLPYSVYEDRLGKDYLNIENLPFKLIVSSWPVRNLINMNNIEM